MNVAECQSKRLATLAEITEQNTCIHVRLIVRLIAEQINTSAEQIILLNFTKHFVFSLFKIIQSYSSENCSARIVFILFVLQRPLQPFCHRDDDILFLAIYKKIAGELPRLDY